MKRIIDIPDELYKKIMGHRALTKYQEHIDYENLKDVIEDSTPLNGSQAEDCISRKQLERELNAQYAVNAISKETVIDVLAHLTSVYPKSEEYEWCKGCKEHDEEHHCCHRYTNFIRYSLNENINAVLEDIKAKIANHKLTDDELIDLEEDSILWGLKIAYDIVDKHMESEDNT